MDPTKDGIEQVISQVLDGTELSMQIDALHVEENFKTGELALRCELHDLHSGEQFTLQSRGSGLVTTFVQAMMDRFGDTYLSLRDVSLVDFTVRGKQEPHKEGRGFDTVAEATVRVLSGTGQGVLFTSTAPSITRASLTTALQGLTFFINSERAFVSLHKALLRARQDKRPDSGQRYTQQLASLVQLSNYSAVLARLPTV